MKKRVHKVISEEVIRRLAEGNASAFDDIYWQYSAHIYNFAKSILYSESQAKDITQTVFMQIWEKRHEIDPAQNFQSYIFTIARNLIYKETLRKVMYESLSEVIDTLTRDEDNTTEKELSFFFTDEHIKKLVETLPESRKAIFKMSRYQHLSNKQIAQKLGISERTVETQIYRSITYLKKKTELLKLVLPWLVILMNVNN